MSQFSCFVTAILDSNKLFGRSGWVRAKLALLAGGHYVICEAHFLPLPPPGNYCTVPKGAVTLPLASRYENRVEGPLSCVERVQLECVGMP